MLEEGESYRPAEKLPMLQKYPIEKGKCGLVCLNCTSYMAGLRKVWRTKSISNVNIDKKVAKEVFQPQKVDDGMVEFVDLSATVLNLAGVEIPKGIDGEPFLGRS